MNADPAAIIKALGASAAACRAVADDVAVWADGPRQEAEQRGVADADVLDDPAYNAALDLFRRAMVISGLADSLLRDFTTWTTSSIQGGSDASLPAVAHAPALPGGSRSPASTRW